jgi:hypothetical protein
MKRFVIIIMASCFWVMPAFAVTPAEDIATTILLRGYDCGGKQVSAIDQQQDASGKRTIRATCPNGVRYQIDISPDGRVSVKPLH